MKILCNKNELLHALQVTSRALPATTAIPELTHIHLEAFENTLKLSATNIKTFISTKIQANVDRQGEILVQGQFFLELVQNLREFSEDKILIDVNPSNNRVLLTLDGQAARYELPGRGREDYPEVELIEADLQMEIPGVELKEILKVGSICSATSDNSIQGFRGICMDISNDRLTVASMDGNRLVKASRPSPVLVDTKIRWLISMDVISEILKILPDSPIVLRQQHNKFLLQFENTVFQSALSDAEFVDYEDYIPQDLSGGLLLNNSSFTGHLKGLLPVSRESGNRVVLEIRANQLGISSFSEKYGEGYRELHLEEGSIVDEPITVAFNSKFLLDYLNSVGDTIVSVQCEGEGMPAYFWPKNQSEKLQHVCVIMSLSM